MCARSACTLGAAGAVLAAVVGVAAVGRAAEESAVAVDAVLVAIELDCRAPIDRTGLLRLVPAQVGAPVNAATLDEGRQRLLATHLFTEVSVRTVPRNGGVAAVYYLERKAIVNAVRFRGNRIVTDEELGRVVRLREGTALGPGMSEAAATRVRERYIQEGFDVVRVQARIVILDPGEVNLVFDIREGAPQRIGAIEFVGDLPIAESALRKATGVGVGTRYTRAREQAAAAGVVRRLRRRGYYEAEVEAQWARGADHWGVLRLTVTAGPRFEVTFVGNSHLQEGTLLALMDLPTRPIITDGTWRQLARRARRAYQEAGFYQATVTVAIEPTTPKRVRFTVNEGVECHVEQVVFTGNRALSAETLRAQMETQPPSWIPWSAGVFLDDVFDEDLRRIWYLYRRRGFQAAEITDAWAEVDGNQIRPHVVIDEGPESIVREIVAPRAVGLVSTAPALQLQVGVPLDPDQVEADRQAWLSAFRRAGYADATVEAQVRLRSEGASDAATVEFDAEPGERQRVGAIVVQNNFDTRSRVILRELPFKSGDPLDPDALLDGQKNIYRLGLFGAVGVEPAERAWEPGTRDVLVSVSERPAGLLQWGAGYNTRDGLRGSLEVGYRNLQGLARQLSLRGEVGLDPHTFNPDDYIGNLTFREPRLGDSQWSLRSSLIAQRSTQSIDQYSVQRYAFIPGTERYFRPGLVGGAELLVENAQVFDVKPDVLAYNPRDAGRLQTVGVGPFLVYDRRDDAFSPRRGFLDSIRVKFAPGEFGSDVPLVKLSGQHVHYLPVLDDLGFVYSLRGGWAKAYHDGDRVSIRDRFFLGGRTTVRGFSENSIGPTGSAGNPIGGDWVVNLNTELRFPLLAGFGGVVFVDGGGAYLSGFPESLHDFRRSTGLGLRYLTPVGPMSLEYGFKLDRRTDESIGEVHFTIGNIF